MFISEAFAQAGGEAGTGEFLISLLPLILIFVVFYFLLIRPQQKRMKEHKEMLGALRRGDRVVTGGGIIGQVVKVADDEATVEIGEGMRVKVVRSTIQSVLSKPEPRGGRGRRRDEDEDEAEESEGDSGSETAASGGKGRR
ncbi:MAG: preprotein translocase subunit YajC [Alphaproteobacteria bacterium]|jgi:preprotein translocase subunit YajC|nr:preprotein translocase subunit YajC [Alphaproteobacteria bacterium]